MKNIIKYFALVCGFIASMFVFGANEADAYKFYYNSDAVGVKYDADGYITNFKDTIVIYGQDDKAGYTVAYSNSKQIRIKEIAITVGNSTKLKLVEGDTYKIKNLNANEGEVPAGGYAISNFGSRSNNDEITIYLQKALDNSTFTNYKNVNDIKITISLEKKGFCFIGCSWDSYSSINYINSASQGNSSGVLLKKSDTTFLWNQLNTSTTEGDLSYQSGKVVNGEAYFNRASTKSSYYYTVKTKFKLNTGSKAFVTYTDLNNKKTSSEVVSLTSYTNYSQAKITNTKLTGVFESDVYNKFNFHEYTIVAIDMYGVGKEGSTVTKVVDCTDKFLIVATKSPKIEGVTLSSSVTEAYGAMEVYTVFDMSGMDYTNNTYTYKITSVSFNVGSKSITKVCNNCSDTVNSSSKNVQKSFVIYANESTGEITYKNAVISVTDKYGNTKSYTANTTITATHNNSMELLSNAAGAEFASTYTHYYNGDTMSFAIVLKSQVNTTVGSIALVDDNDNEYVIHNEEIKKTAVSSQTFNLTSSAISYDGEKAWTGVKLIDVCDAAGAVCLDHVISAGINFNSYRTISVSETITNANSFVITGIDAEGLNIVQNKIAFTNHGGATIAISGACSYDGAADTPFVTCAYSNSGSDGYANVKINKGAVILTNGQRNGEVTFKIIDNKNAPTTTVSSLNGEQTYYDASSSKYYYKGTKSLTIVLNDGYCGSGKLHYTFATEYDFIAFSCGNENKLEASQLVVPLPVEDGDYTFKYYVSSDGIESSVVTHNYGFVARNELSLADAVININGDPFLANKENDYFNSVVIGIDNVTVHSLLTKYRMQFNEDLSYTEVSLNKGNNTYTYGEASRSDLVDVNGIKVPFTITLFDELGNSKEYKYEVNIDTLTPVAPDPRVTVSGSNYVVTIANYADYTTGDIITIAYNETEAYCTKGVDATCAFTINDDIYALKATDRANNSSDVTRYTALATNANVLGDYLQVYPFLSEVYDVRNDVKIRVVTYAYTQSSINDPSNITRMCSSVTTVECYTTYTLTSTSMYELVGNELNIKIDSLRLKNNATYAFLVSLGNSSSYLKNDSDAYPRKNIEFADVSGPELVVNSITANPRLVSDSTNSTNTFTFNFSVTDSNLSNLAKFEYLIINKSNVSGYTITNTKFSEYLNYCPRNWTNYLNVCGQWSSELLDYSSVNGNSASGVITMAKNGNMLNNTTYILFVRAYDNTGNYSILTLNEFVNINDAVDVYYKDGDAGSEQLAQDNMIKTINANANLIVRKNTSLSEDVEIASVKLNGNTISNSYRVGKGVHTLEVKDTLGNVETITIYCGALSKPDIQIYNYYDGEYYPISSEAAYAYNSATLVNLYVKISGTNIQDISINDGLDTLYGPSSDIFKKITNATGTNEYGMKLSELIDNTSGSVVISATGDGGEISSITLNVDNQVPVIQILSGLATSNVYLFDNPYTISLVSARTYSLQEANYKYELNYEYLFATARLNLIVDDKTFDVASKTNNLIVKLDGVRISDYTTPIATLASGSILSVEYFDDAGNIAQPLQIEVKIVDKEAPEFAGLEEVRNVETNETVLLLDEAVSVSDNFNSPEDINIKASVDGVQIYNNKYSGFKTVTYNFTQSREYTVTFVLTDTNGNVSSTFTQKVVASDTTGPELIGTFTMTNMSLGSLSIINLPALKDTDAGNTTYYPSVVEFYVGVDLVDSSLYTATFDTDTLALRFLDAAPIGNYTIVLKTTDAQGNTTLTNANFVVSDTSAPTINLYVNGVLVTGDTATLVFGDTNYTISQEAIDAHDGKLSVTVSGDRINVNKQGNYTYTLKAKDKSNNQTTRSVTIVVEPDVEKPVINKVTIGKTVLLPSNESLTLYTSISYKYETLKVDATDNASLGQITINYNGVVIRNDSQITFTDGESFTIVVEVSDSSGNSVSSTYYVTVDNSAPVLSGIDNYRVYDSALHGTITDRNLMEVKLYKNDTLIREFAPATRTETFVADLTEIGKYRIVATDTFKNEAVYVFEIKEKLATSITSGDGTTSEIKTGESYLVEITLGAANTLVINVNKDNNIEKNDQVYVVVKDPSTGAMHLVYSTNGSYYNGQKTIVVSGNVINGVSNAETLETIGEKSYAYLLVVKTDVNEPNSNTENKGLSEGVKSALLTVGGIILAILIVFLIIKFRRKVRAV